MQAALFCPAFGVRVMFHHGDHLRFQACDSLSSLRRTEAFGMRPCARNTDLNAFLDSAGLSGRARKI